MRAPVQADLIQRKLFTVHYHMYATKTYLEKYGTPHTLDDIAAHTIIAYGETAAPEISRDQLAARADPPPHGRQGPHGAHQQRHRHSLRDGSQRRHRGGADYVSAERPHLVRVPADVPGPSFDVHLVYADALRQSKRVVGVPGFSGEGVEGLAVLTSPVSREEVEKSKAFSGEGSALHASAPHRAKSKAWLREVLRQT